MALGATMRRFEIALSDTDRGVYEQIDLRVAQHPSESDRFLVARVIARALEHDERVEFGRGVSTDEEPAIWQRDLRGDLVAWIEVGAPSPERLHRASKSGARIAVYAWKDPAGLAAAIVEEEVHRGDAIAIYGLDPGFLDAIAAGLDRNNRWEMSVAGGHIFLGTGAGQHESSIAMFGAAVRSGA
jgi:uncharacterized protein YaeQ